MQAKSFFKRVSSYREAGAVVPLILLIVIFSFSSPIFFTANNLFNISRQVSVISVLAIAMTFVIVSGGIDLSVGSVLAVSGIATATALKDFGLPIFISILIGILTGCVTGICNGLLVSYLNMPPFITTMGTMTILRGLGFIYTQGYPIYNLPAEYKLIGQGYLGVIPSLTIILLVVAVIAAVVLRSTIFGRHVYAIGGNIESANLAGIKVNRVKLLVYVISGFLCAVAGVMQSARVGSGLPATGAGYELEAIAAVVIGGASMTGGSGTIIGTILGSIILGVLSNGLSLLDVDSYVMDVVSGSVVILAVLVDIIRTRLAQNARVKATRSALEAKARGAAEKAVK